MDREEDMTLAAAAYDAEQEHVDTSLEVRDAMGVRDLMLRLAKLEQTDRELRDLCAAINDRYGQRLAGIAEEQAAIRQSIENYIVAVNGGEKVSIPDAGTAYLTTKNKGGKAKLADNDAFRRWLVDTYGVKYVVETEPQFDARASLELAHDALFYCTPDGKLVHRETGEVIEIPGVEAMPETKTLALRKA